MLTKLALIFIIWGIYGDLEKTVMMQLIVVNVD